MKNGKRIFMLGLALTFILTMGLVGCSNTGSTTSPSPFESTGESVEISTAALTGTLNMGGSTSVETVVNAVLAEFIALNPGTSGKYDSTGSSTGITNAQDGTYHLGYLSRDLKDAEKIDGLTSQIFAIDGITIVINPANKVTNLTTEQLLGIYTGTITNWSEVGGTDAGIVVVSREEGSGTRDGFQTLIGFTSDVLVANATIKDGNGNVATYVAEEANAIGYVSFVTLEENADSIVGLTVNNIEPIVDNVKNNTYPLFRPFVIAYMDANLNDAEKAYVDFLMSAEGQQIVVDNGAISILK